MTTALVLVDAQMAFANMIPGGLNNPAIANIVGLYRRWMDDGAGDLIFLPYVAWKSAGEGGNVATTYPELANELRPGTTGVELVPGLPQSTSQEFEAKAVRKLGFDATHNTGLVDKLKASGVRSVVVAGLTTPVCVLATVKALYQENRGFQVTVCSDACASQDFPDLASDVAHRAALSIMAGLGVHVKMMGRRLSRDLD